MSEERIVPALVPDEKISAQQAAYQTVAALQTLEQHYRANISAFAEELHTLSLRIDEAAGEIESLESSIRDEEAAIRDFDEAIASDMRLLDALNERYIRKLHTIAEIKKEIARLDAGKRPDLQHRYDDAQELLDEIEELEIVILQKELERQNLTLKVAPVRQKIAALHADIRRFEAQKRHLESTGLHRLSPALPDASSAAAATDEEVIDTDIDKRDEAAEG